MKVIPLHQKNRNLSASEKGIHPLNRLSNLQQDASRRWEIDLTSKVLYEISSTGEQFYIIENERESDGPLLYVMSHALGGVIQRLIVEISLWHGRTETFFGHKAPEPPKASDLTITLWDFLNPFCQKGLEELVYGMPKLFLIKDQDRPVAHSYFETSASFIRQTLNYTTNSPQRFFLETADKTSLNKYPTIPLFGPKNWPNMTDLSKLAIR